MYNQNRILLGAYLQKQKQEIGYESGMWYQGSRNQDQKIQQSNQSHNPFYISESQTSNHCQVYKSQGSSFVPFGQSLSLSDAQLRQNNRCGRNDSVYSQLQISTSLLEQYQQMLVNKMNEIISHQECQEVIKQVSRKFTQLCHKLDVRQTLTQKVGNKQREQQQLIAKIQTRNKQIVKFGDKMYINLLSTDSINKLLTYAERINIRSVVEVAVNQYLYDLIHNNKLHYHYHSFIQINANSNMNSNIGNSVIRSYSKENIKANRQNRKDKIVDRKRDCQKKRQKIQNGLNYQNMKTRQNNGNANKCGTNCQFNGLRNFIKQYKSEKIYKSIVDMWLQMQKQIHRQIYDYIHKQASSHHEMVSYMRKYYSDHKQAQEGVGQQDASKLGKEGAVCQQVRWKSECDQNMIEQAKSQLMSAKVDLEILNNQLSIMESTIGLSSTFFKYRQPCSEAGTPKNKYIRQSFIKLVQTQLGNCKKNNKQPYKQIFAKSYVPYMDLYNDQAHGDIGGQQRLEQSYHQQESSSLFAEDIVLIYHQEHNQYQYNNEEYYDPKYSGEHVQQAGKLWLGSQNMNLLQRICDTFNKYLKQVKQQYMIELTNKQHRNKKRFSGGIYKEQKKSQNPKPQSIIAYKLLVESQLKNSVSTSMSVQTQIASCSVKIGSQNYKPTYASDYAQAYQEFDKIDVIVLSTFMSALAWSLEITQNIKQKEREISQLQNCFKQIDGSGEQQFHGRSAAIADSYIKNELKKSQQIFTQNRESYSNSTKAQIQNKNNNRKSQVKTQSKQKLQIKNRFNIKDIQYRVRKVMHISNTNEYNGIVEITNRINNNPMIKSASNRTIISMPITRKSSLKYGLSDKIASSGVTTRSALDNRCSITTRRTLTKNKINQKSTHSKIYKNQEYCERIVSFAKNRLILRKQNPHFREQIDIKRITMIRLVSQNLVYLYFKKGFMSLEFVNQITPNSRQAVILASKAREWLKYFKAIYYQYIEGIEFVYKSQQPELPPQQQILGQQGRLNLNVEYVQSHNTSGHENRKSLMDCSKQMGLQYLASGDNKQNIRQNFVTFTRHQLFSNCQNMMQNNRQVNMMNIQIRDSLEGTKQNATNDHVHKSNRCEIGRFKELIQYNYEYQHNNKLNPNQQYSLNIEGQIQNQYANKPPMHAQLELFEPTPKYSSIEYLFQQEELQVKQQDMPSQQSQNWDQQNITECFKHYQINQLKVRVRPLTKIT